MHRFPVGSRDDAIEIFRGTPARGPAPFRPDRTHALRPAGGACPRCDSAGGRGWEIGQGLELVALHRDGSEVAVEISLAPVTFEDGESAILDELCDQLTAVTATHEVTCAAPSDLIVHADEHALTRIMTNLLTNATRYSPPGSRLQVTARRDGDHVVVEVSDEGPGIPVEDRERIFDMFHRGSDPAVMAQPGSGIGLSVVRDLVTLQEGTVVVIDGVASGATLQIRLPLVD